MPDSKLPENLRPYTVSQQHCEIFNHIWTNGLTWTRQGGKCQSAWQLVLIMRKLFHWQEDSKNCGCLERCSLPSSSEHMWSCRGAGWSKSCACAAFPFFHKLFLSLTPFPFSHHFSFQGVESAPTLPTLSKLVISKSLLSPKKWVILNTLSLVLQ